MSSLQYKCTKLSVIQGLKEGSLDGPFRTEFTFDDISVSISQMGKREIELTSNVPMTAEELITNFQNVEKLLMVFDGRFYTIEKLTLTNENAEPEDILNEYEKSRLNYFCSKDLCQYLWLKLISFQMY